MSEPTSIVRSHWDRRHWVVDHWESNHWASAMVWIEGGPAGGRCDTQRADGLRCDAQRCDLFRGSGAMTTGD